MGEDFNMNLDLKKEANDKKLISILMDEYTPEEFKMFFILHIMRNIYEMAERDEIHRKNIGFFRELNYFMKVQDESAQNSEQNSALH